MPVDFEIPAEGEVPVTDFFAKSPFDRDVYVKALEVRPGTPGVVHHAGLYVIDRLPDGAALINGRIVDSSGRPMSRNQVARANGGTTTQEMLDQMSRLEGKLDEAMGRFEKSASRSATTATSGPEAQQLYDQASQDLTQGRYSLALQNFRE